MGRIWICEYMAARKPVIVVNVGGVKDIIKNNENGIMIENYDAKEFVGKIFELKNNKQLKERLINKAFIDVESKYSVEREVNNIEKYL